MYIYRYVHRLLLKLLMQNDALASTQHVFSVMKTARSNAALTAWHASCIRNSFSISLVGLMQYSCAAPLVQNIQGVHRHTCDYWRMRSLKVEINGACKWSQVCWEEVFLSISCRILNGLTWLSIQNSHRHTLGYCDKWYVYDSIAMRARTYFLNNTS